jgi:hypothetical protein
MKRRFVSLLLISFIFGFSAKNMFAQTTRYNWSKYGVSFAIPNTHEVKKSSAEEFESGDATTWLQMYPFADVTQTAKGMIDEVVSSGGYTIENEGAYTSGGYDGYWVRCSSTQYPTWKFWLIGFIDPGSATNFYSIIWWKKGNDAAYKIASDMSYSFKKIN